ncbi:MAG: glycosyltransferase family 2 protein, partial [Sciscionella sp.]
RFAAITAVLPLRRVAGRAPEAANFTVTLRVRVLLHVLAMAPAALRERRVTDSTTSRRAVWSDWAGHTG